MASGAQITTNCAFTAPVRSYGEEKIPPRDKVQQCSCLDFTPPVFWDMAATLDNTDCKLAFLPRPIYLRIDNKRDYVRGWLSSSFPNLILHSKGKVLLVREKIKLATALLLLFRAK